MGTRSRVDTSPVAQGCPRGLKLRVQYESHTRSDPFPPPRAAKRRTPRIADLRAGRGIGVPSGFASEDERTGREAIAVGDRADLFEPTLRTWRCATALIRHSWANRSRANDLSALEEPRAAPSEPSGSPRRSRCR